MAMAPDTQRILLGNLLPNISDATLQKMMQILYTDPLFGGQVAPPRNAILPANEAVKEFDLIISGKRKVWGMNGSDRPSKTFKVLLEMERESPFDRSSFHALSSDIKDRFKKYNSETGSRLKYDPLINQLESKL